MSLTLGTSLLRLRRYEHMIRWPDVTVFHRQTAPAKSLKAGARMLARFLASRMLAPVPGFRLRALRVAPCHPMALVMCCAERGKSMTLIAVRVLSALYTDAPCRYSRSLLTPRLPVCRLSSLTTRLVTLANAFHEVP